RHVGHLVVSGGPARDPRPDLAGAIRGFSALGEDGRQEILIHAVTVTEDVADSAPSRRGHGADFAIASIARAAGSSPHPLGWGFGLDGPPPQRNRVRPIGSAS